MSTFISNRLADYPNNFYTGKKVSVSNTVFDFDSDGVNEIMLSFCEEFILLHYYNGRVYGYSLGGYRNSMDWSIEGVAANSGSLVEIGYKKYSFNGSELLSQNIASSGYENIEVSYDLKYEVEGKVVNKDTFIAYVEKLNKVDSIKYVEYSK